MIFATGNMGKMKEIKAILGDIGEEILSMKEAGIDMDIVEDGNTFEENAIIKAKAVMERTGQLALADDSGLEIDALNKEPGIYSARYMGEDTPYEIKNSNLIERMKGVKGKDRSARFRMCYSGCFSGWRDNNNTRYDRGRYSGRTGRRKRIWLRSNRVCS